MSTLSRIRLEWRRLGGVAAVLRRTREICAAEGARGLGARFAVLLRKPPAPKPNLAYVPRSVDSLERVALRIRPVAVAPVVGRHDAPSALHESVALAIQYGIRALCFRESGPRPSAALRAFLADPSLDIAFCVHGQDTFAAALADPRRLRDAEGRVTRVASGHDEAGGFALRGSPGEYAGRLRRACAAAVASSGGGPPLVFFESPERPGSLLLPDPFHGYAFLHAAANVVRDFGDYSDVDQLLATHNRDVRKAADVAVVLHLYYDDLFEEFCARYLPQLANFDFFVSVRRDIAPARLRAILARLPNSRVVALRNIGRDVLPFLHFLPAIIDQDYALVCKLHTKRSPHRGDGERLRHNAFDSLAGSTAGVGAIVSRLRDDLTVGAVVPAGAISTLAQGERFVGNARWLGELLRRWGIEGAVDWKGTVFPAGTMFWARTTALRRLLDLGIHEGEFEPELGQVDGTLAHAVERVVGVAISMDNGRLVDTAALETAPRA